MTDYERLILYMMLAGLLMHACEDRDEKRTFDEHILALEEKR